MRTFSAKINKKNIIIVFLFFYGNLLSQKIFRDTYLMSFTEYFDIPVFMRYIPNYQRDIFCFNIEKEYIRTLGIKKIRVGNDIEIVFNRKGEVIYSKTDSIVFHKNITEVYSNDKTFFYRNNRLVYEFLKNYLTKDSFYLRRYIYDDRGQLLLIKQKEYEIALKKVFMTKIITGIEVNIDSSSNILLKCWYQNNKLCKRIFRNGSSISIYEEFNIQTELHKYVEIEKKNLFYNEKIIIFFQYPLVIKKHIYYRDSTISQIRIDTMQFTKDTLLLKTSEYIFNYVNIENHSFLKSITFNNHSGNALVIKYNKNLLIEKVISYGRFSSVFHSNNFEYTYFLFPKINKKKALPMYDIFPVNYYLY